MKMSKNFSCGSRVRELRTERGLSQEQVALAAGITPAYLGQVERGQKNPTVQTIERVCGAMSVPLSIFFSGAETALPVSDDIDRQIMGQLSTMTTEERTLVLQVVKSMAQLRLVVLQGKDEKK